MIHMTNASALFLPHVFCRTSHRSPLCHSTYHVFTKILLHRLSHRGLFSYAVDEILHGPANLGFYLLAGETSIIRIALIFTCEKVVGRSTPQENLVGCDSCYS